MFGEDEEVRKLKRDLQSAGCDMDVVKRWQKQLDGIKKHCPSIYGGYCTAREKLLLVETYMKQMEQLLLEKRTWTKDEMRRISDIRRELKRLANTFDNELLVSREDKEFHLTYETILKLADKYDGTDDARILLKSEIENLLALVREDLEKERPDAAVLTFFYLEHRDTELVDLPPAGRMDHILAVYEKEFLRPILRQTARCDEVSVDQVNGIIERMVQL